MVNRVTAVNCSLGLGIALAVTGAIGLGLAKAGVVGERALGAFATMIAIGGVGASLSCSLRRQAIQPRGAMAAMPAELQREKREAVAVLKAEARPILERYYRQDWYDPGMGIEEASLVELPLDLIVPATARWLISYAAIPQGQMNEYTRLYEVQDAYAKLHTALNLEIELAEETCPGCAVHWRPIEQQVAAAEAYRDRVPADARADADRLVQLVRARQVALATRSPQRLVQQSAILLGHTRSISTMRIHNWLQDLDRRAPLQGLHNRRPGDEYPLRMDLIQYLVPLARRMAEARQAQVVSQWYLDDQIQWPFYCRTIELEKVQLNMELGFPLDVYPSPGDQLAAVRQLQHPDQARLARLTQIITAQAEARQIYNSI